MACAPRWRHVGQRPQVVTPGCQWSCDQPLRGHRLGPLFQQQNGTSALAGGTNQKVLVGGIPGPLTAGPAPGTWSVDTPESLRGPPGPPPGAPDPGPVQAASDLCGLCGHRNYGRATSAQGGAGRSRAWGCLHKGWPSGPGVAWGGQQGLWLGAEHGPRQRAWGVCPSAGLRPARRQMQP